MAGPAAIGMQFAGGVVTAMGIGDKASADANAHQYQAGIAQINSQIAKQNADYSRSVGEVEAQTEGMKTAQDIASTKATQSGSGVSVSSGSNAAVRASQEEVGVFDQAMIRSNAARRAYGYEVEAASETAKAGMEMTAASNIRRASSMAALGSLLSTASSVAGKWSTYGSTFGSTELRDGTRGMGLPDSGTGGLY